MSRPITAMLDVLPELSQQQISAVFGEKFDVVFAEDDSAGAKIAAAKDASALLTLWGSVDAATIAAAGPCRVIQKLGIGIDKIDVEAARRRGITVLNAPGINAEAVAELTVLLILGVARNIAKAMLAAQVGRAAKESLRVESFQIAGKSIGLLGFGNIGRAVAERLSGFGVNVTYHDIVKASAAQEERYRVSYAELDELLSRSDIISLHVPLTPVTRNLIDGDAIAKMKQDAVIINTARGEIIDEGALAAAIQSGRISGAGLDVTSEEPLPSTSPLLGRERVLITPHIGGAVANNFPRVVSRAFRNVSAVLDGRPVDESDVLASRGALTLVVPPHAGDRPLINQPTAPEGR